MLSVDKVTRCYLVEFHLNQVWVGFGSTYVNIKATFCGLIRKLELKVKRFLWKNQKETKIYQMTLVNKFLRLGLCVGTIISENRWMSTKAVEGLGKVQRADLTCRVTSISLQ